MYLYQSMTYQIRGDKYIESKTHKVRVNVHVVCGNEYLGSEPQSLHHCQGYIIIFRSAGERNSGYALLIWLISQKQRCTELPLFLFLRHMVELVYVRMTLISILLPNENILNAYHTIVKSLLHALINETYLK